MKRTLLTILAVMTTIMFLASSAMAGKGSYKRCKEGCNRAKAALLKQCDKAEGAEAKSKCRTMGSKKLMEECLLRCNKRKGK